MKRDCLSCSLQGRGDKGGTVGPARLIVSQVCTRALSVTHDFAETTLKVVSICNTEREFKECKARHKHGKILEAY